MKDMRSPLAKARDKWFDSQDGKACQEGATQGQYLRNRLEQAFIAGWEACEKKLKSTLKKTRQ